MSYLSIDTETTGIKDWCQIIEFGAIIDDGTKPLEDSPAFHRYVTHEKIVGEPYALAMNAEILRKLAEPHKYPECKFVAGSQLIYEFAEWLVLNYLLDFDIPISKHPKLVAAGKNFTGFDKRFLSQLPGWEGLPFHHRALDPGGMYWEPNIDGDVPPDTKTCMKRAGIPGDVAHNALEDAVVVAQLIRKVKDWRRAELIVGG